MAIGALRSLIEKARCAKHNLLDRVPFHLSYRDGRYYVRVSDGTTLRFPHNAFLPFYEMTKGYLKDGAWTLSEGMYVVDAGACHGEFALYASRKVGPSGRVFVFEPDPTNAEYIRDVFRLNGGLPGNVVVIEAGLWKEPGRISFAARQNDSSSIIGACHEAAIDSGEVITIEVESLDHFVASNGLPRLDFVKMDIEGAEVEAVEGAAAALRHFSIRFSIASYHLRDGRPTSQVIERTLSRAGYLVETGFPEHQTTYARRLN